MQEKLKERGQEKDVLQEVLMGPEGRTKRTGIFPQVSTVCCYYALNFNWNVRQYSTHK